jgi:hypothetical protein
MKVYVLKYFFNGDDVENETKGVYTDKSKAKAELEKLVKYENDNNISEYDEPFKKCDNPYRYEGYVQHFGPIYYEIETLELDKESEVNNFEKNR